MYEYHVIFGFLAVGIALFRYGLYFHDIGRGVVKPHVFSWFIWALLTGITFFAQMSSGAGPGAWVTGIVAGGCLAISITALFYGTKDITITDRIAFLGALLAIGIWVMTTSVLTAVIIALVADGLGYYPTYRKSFRNPQEESASGFTIAALRSIVSIIALSTFTVVTLLPPVFYFFTDGTAALIIYWRRRNATVNGST